jgi:hypothetical protein
MHTGGGRAYMQQKLCSTKLANGDPCMHTGRERVYMRRKLVRNSQMGIPVYVMKLCAERSLTHHKLIPVCIRGLPVCVRGGRPEVLHMGSPAYWEQHIHHVVWEIPTQNVHHLID